MTLLAWGGAAAAAVWAAWGTVAWVNAAGARDEYREMRQHDAMRATLDAYTVKELDR